MHYGSVAGIAPKQVDEAVLERLRNAMSITSLIRKPMAASRAVVCWMTRSRGARLAQHRLAVLELRDRYHVELERRRWRRS
jgi:hypothetical protein